MVYNVRSNGEVWQLSQTEVNSDSQLLLPLKTSVSKKHRWSLRYICKPHNIDHFLTEVSDVPHWVNVGVVLVEHDEHRWCCDAVCQSLTVKVLPKTKQHHKTINSPQRWLDLE